MFTIDDWEAINIDNTETKQYFKRAWYDSTKDKLNTATNKINGAASDAYNSASDTVSNTYNSVSGKVTDTWDSSVAQFEETKARLEDAKEKLDKILKFISYLPWIFLFSFIFFVLVICLIIFFIIRHRREKSKRQRKQMDDLTAAINRLIKIVDPNAETVDINDDDDDEEDVVEVKVNGDGPKDSTTTLTQQVNGEDAPLTNKEKK